MIIQWVLPRLVTVAIMEGFWYGIGQRRLPGRGDYRVSALMRCWRQA